ncbi:hypothetical protein SAMN05216410_3497 [Sanguibacter gelidistatuariae]|uniref:Uncharacterized protein n=1 Tax=Sanguibacter gelidistatuariae TaxID=1814289 RepID=A0A1G6VPB3_9MICO|nr:hypothetical protein [Sanguibacter gelidistatuariae]SDD55263.1 hypothetical protein SAMN05216410_3497 [Sanguibacter gelidistatuariae]
MATLTEIFTAPRATALARARAAEDGATPAPLTDLLATTEITDFEIEVLGELIARAVHAEGINCEPDLVDIDLPDLFEIPADLVAACVELSVHDADPAESADLADIAAGWATAEDMELDPALTPALVRRIVELAVLAHGRGDGLFLWTSV